MKQIPTLDKINVKNKLALVRLDLNSPVLKRKVSDNPRFEASSKTISYLQKNKARTIILAHQGRKGSSDFLPLKQHAKILSKYTKSKIKYIPDLFGKKSQKAIGKLKPGQAILLENVRFFKDEKDIKNKNNNYIKFSKQFDLYINDAFSVSHREQGSIIIPPKYLPSYIGLQFESELNALKKLKTKSKKRVIILGGAKIDDYFPIFNLLKDKKTKLLPAGVLANIFLIAKGVDLGYENEWLKKHSYYPLLPKIKSIYNKYKKQIILPEDFGLITNNDKRFDVNLNQAPYKFKIFDIGKKTILQFKKEIKSADFIFMKGPMGFSEIPAFSFGTVSVLKAISKNKKFSLLGGGHLTSTLKKYKIPNNFSHISLSGGALITHITGKKLPGIEAIKNSKHKL